MSEPIGTRPITPVLRESILSGELGGDGPLPSERVLSQQLGVGRAMLRQALDELTREGLVRRAGPRVRTVVRGRATVQPAAGDAAWLRKAVAVLAPELKAGGEAATRTRWLRFVTLGTVEALRAAGLHAITLNTSELNGADAQRLAAGRPLGLLIPDMPDIGPAVIEMVDAFRAAGVPVVAYGGNPQLGAVDRVQSDHEAGSYELTRRAIAQGRCRIAQFWPKPWDRYWYDARDRGYRRAVAEAGLEPQPMIEFPWLHMPAPDEATFQYAVRQVAGFLVDRLTGPERVDALLLGTDRDAFYAAAALRLYGFAPGREVWVAGYDDSADRCEERQWEPELPAASVNKDNEAMGEMMVRLLLDRVAGRLPPEPQTRVIAPRLVSPSIIENISGS